MGTEGRAQLRIIKKLIYTIGARMLKAKRKKCIKGHIAGNMSIESVFLRGAER